MKRCAALLLLVLAIPGYAQSFSNKTVAASADDAQQVGTTVTINGTTIGASLDATTDWVGVRFNSVNIPNAATISAATLGVVPSGTAEDEPLVTIFGEAADDCVAFTTGASDITNRSRTTASAAWNSGNMGADGATYFDAPSLVTIVQEIVNRAGWVPNNDLCLIIQGGATSTRDLTIEAYDLGPGTNPPRLSATWSVANPRAAAAYHRNQLNLF